jgi:hypothetical protein
MGIAAGMKVITQDIASSHEDRIKRIGEIRQDAKEVRGEAQDMIKSFEDSRQEANRQLKRDLARDKAKMRGEVKTTRNGFQNSHKKMSSALKKDLAEHAQEVRGGVAKMRQETGASHQNMSAKLRKNLARGAAARKSEAHVMLNGFQRSHKQMGGQLRRDLAQSRVSIESDVKQMQSDCRKARGNVRADLKEARAAWQGVGSTMQVKRSGTKTPPKVAAPAAKKENPDLETKLLAAIGEYPAGGITLAELANTLGVAPVVLGRVSKSLMKKGKIRKDEKLYFPASAE